MRQNKCLSVLFCCAIFLGKVSWLKLYGFTHPSWGYDPIFSFRLNSSSAGLTQRVLVCTLSHIFFLSLARIFFPDLVKKFVVSLFCSLVISSWWRDAITTDSNALMKLVDSNERNPKMNLHSIRFSYVFVRFFTFLLLLDKVCACSSAFLCVHVRTNQTVTYWTKIFRKNFFVKGYSSILKYRSYPSYTKFLNKIFTYIQQST